MPHLVENMATIPANVINRYAAKNALSITESMAIFGELEFFLQNASVARLSPSEIIDGAWHEFILHTKQYTDYCGEQFGRYIHHLPTDDFAQEGLASCHDCSTSCVSPG
jgi:hypothetical protein